jgi:hypothetical protein
MNIDTAWDWTWSDGFLPEVRRILGVNAMHLLEVGIASAQQDMKQATDMLVTVRGEIAIAVRLRRPTYTHRDLTIRAMRSSGVKTELEKIQFGAGDFYLYGWTNAWCIPEWMLVNLHRLRDSGLLNRNWQLIRNKDNRTAFIAIPYTLLKQYGCVVNMEGLKG